MNNIEYFFKNFEYVSDMTRYANTNIKNGIYLVSFTYNPHGVIIGVFVRGDVPNYMSNYQLVEKTLKNQTISTTSPEYNIVYN